MELPGVATPHAPFPKVGEQGDTVSHVELHIERQAMVYWENEAIYTPELYVFYEDGSELFTFTWYEENVGENLWQYGYPDEGFGWENVTEAYLSFTNYGWAEDDSTVDSYYEVRVNITEAFSGIA